MPAGCFDARQRGQEVCSGEDARVYEHLVGDVNARDSFAQVGDALSALDPLEQIAFKVPRRDDLVAVEEEDLGRPRDGLNVITFLKICQLL